MVLTHVPMGVLPPGWVNLYDHVHHNEPLRETLHINVCVELARRTRKRGSRHSSATTAARSSITCAALIGVDPAVCGGSVQPGAKRPAAT